MPAPPVQSAIDLLELSAVDAVNALKRGEVTAERYSSVLLARCEAAKSLNAFITLEPERVLVSARSADRRRAAGMTLGPLHGLPIPIKDSVNTKEYPTTGATRALRRFRAAENAPLVQSLVDAGAIVMGKTNIHELSWGWSSNNHVFGPVRNPYDQTRIPGGSSGGTAAAVAARMAPLGVAEDTEGSIRVPAALCGLVGFRPTTGRYRTTGGVPITALFDQLGPLARSAGDLVLFDAVVTADHSPILPAPLKGIRLGVARGYYFGDLDPEVGRVTATALRKLQDAGVELVEAEVPDLAELIALTTAQIEGHDAYHELKTFLEEHRTGVTIEQLIATASDDIRADFELTVMPGARRRVTDEAYRLARDVHLPRLRDVFRTHFSSLRVAALVFPTTMMPALPIGQEGEVEVAGKKLAFETVLSRNIRPGSTAGLPGLVLPAGMTADGLPVTLEFDGPTGTDPALLALALSFERTFGRIPAPHLARS